MKRAKGTFWMRFSIFLLAVIFGVLVYWSADFLLDDIRVLRLPNREAFFEQRRDASLQTELKKLERQLEDLDQRQTLITQQRGFIKDSSSALKITVDNLFALKDRSQQLISEEQFSRVLSTLDRIIRIQDEFRETADEYLQITTERYELTRQIAALKQKIDEENRTIQQAFSEVLQRHRFWNTVIKLGCLLPLAVGCSILLVRKRNSIYRLIYFSAAIAVYIKTVQVVHEHFPSRYFKYILIAVLLILVGWGFSWLIRRLARPKIDMLLKQYREAYERFLCPVCEYPIRTGPRKYLYWTRRTIHKTALLSNQGDGQDEVPYTCPSCGTVLFEKCAVCSGVRHSLLPNCQHCGDKKELTGDAY